MKYLKLFENTNSINNYPSTVITNAPIYMDGEEWFEDDRSDSNRSWQEEYIHAGQTLILDDTSLYSDTITYTCDGFDYPIEFTKDNLMHLCVEATVQLCYDIPQDIKNFIEEHLVDLLDSGKIRIEYHCKSVMSKRIRLVVTIGANFKWASVEDAISNLHNVLKDEYNLVSTFINNQTFRRDDDFENARKPTNVHSIMFNINLVNEWYK